MEKEEFNKLKVKDQVEYINQKLDKKSLTEICKDINISRATIRNKDMNLIKFRINIYVL